MKSCECRCVLSVRWHFHSLFVSIGLILAMNCASCLGSGKVLDHYKFSAEQLPVNMVSHKDSTNKMDLMIPPEWKPAPADPEIVKRVKLVSSIKTFRKDSLGSVSIWCDGSETPVPSVKRIEDLVFDLAPLSERVKLIEIEGSNAIVPYVQIYNATHIAKGEKMGYRIFAYVKNRQIFSSLTACEYMLIGRSASLMAANEIEKDIAAIAFTLKN